MTKIIKFLGPEKPLLPHSASPASEFDLTAKLPGAAEVARMIEFFERLGSGALAGVDVNAIHDIRQAFDEGRTGDALDLFDMVIEDQGPYTETEDSPIDGLEIARFGGLVPHVGRPSLKLVGEASQPERLRAGLTLHSGAVEDWRVRCGEFYVGMGDGAELELGLKGDLVLVLLAGEVDLFDLDGDKIMSFASVEGARSVRQIVYCRARDTHNQLLLRIVARGGPARGIWCDSSRSRLIADDRRSDPVNQDVFFVQDYLDIDLPAAGQAFCADAVQIKDDKDTYAHYEGVERGELLRFGFRRGALSRHEHWHLDGWERKTSIIGITSGFPTAVAQRDRAERRLAHHLGVELLVALDGVVWLAVREDPSPGGAETVACKLSDGAAHVTALTVSDTGHDVMLLESAHPHAVWTTPGSDARFLHANFGDPKHIRPMRLRDYRSDGIESDGMTNVERARRQSATGRTKAAMAESKRSVTLK